jgi:hypothetical protein
LNNYNYSDHFYNLFNCKDRFRYVLGPIRAILAELESIQIFYGDKCVDHLNSAINCVLGLQSQLKFHLHRLFDLQNSYKFCIYIYFGLRSLRLLLNQLSGPVDWLFGPQNSYEFFTENMILFGRLSGPIDGLSDLIFLTM